jgi:hypothetical protein
MFTGLLLLFTFTFAGSEECCYVNPSYSGICVVEPAPGETCASILEYLNSAGTVGKTYCDNTAIRGNWKQVQCR